MSHLASSMQAILSSPASAAAGGPGYGSATAQAGAPVAAGRPINAENFDSARSNGHSADHTSAGQWLSYPIHAPSAGDYVFSARVACPSPGAQFHVSFDGENLTGTLALPKTRDWFDWNTVASHPFRLSAGNHVMRLDIDRNASDITAAGNFDTLFVTPIRPGISLTWKPAAEAPAARFEGVGRVVHGKLYTFGGYISVAPYRVSNAASVYDPAAGKWTDLGAMPIPETHCGVAVDDAHGRIWFVGGRRGAYPGVATSEVWQFDTAGNTWTRQTPLPAQLSAGSAEFVNGQIHYMGGNSGQDRSTDYDLHYVLAPGETSWHKAAPLPFARDHFSTAALGGKIYIFGGEVGHDAAHRQQNDGWIYDPAADSWTALAPMPIAKSHAESSTFVLNGRVIFAGGQIDNFQASSDILEYDPATDMWAMLPTLPQPLEGVIVQPLGDRLFVTGGYIGSNSVATVSSYTSNPFTGTPNSAASLAAQHLVLPLIFGTMMTMSGLFAVLARRRRKSAR